MIAAALPGRRPTLLGRRQLTAQAVLDLEHTADSLHAHVEIDGIDLGPGDEVLLLGVDSRLRFGERRRRTAVAVVTRAGWLRRHWFRLTSMLQLTSLYDISFSDRRVL
jgi:hypothetical protein